MLIRKKILEEGEDEAISEAEKPNHRNEEEGGLQDRGGETPGRGLWTKRKPGASLAAADAAAEAAVHGGIPDLAAGGENAAAVAVAAGIAADAGVGAGAEDYEDHCTSLRLCFGDRERSVGVKEEWRFGIADEGEKP